MSDPKVENIDKCSDWFSSDAFKTSCWTDAALVVLFKIPDLYIEEQFKNRFRQSVDNNINVNEWLNQDILNNYTQQGWTSWLATSTNVISERERIIWNKPVDNKELRIVEYRKILLLMKDLIDVHKYGGCNAEDKVTSQLSALRESFYKVGFIEKEYSYDKVLTFILRLLKTFNITMGKRTVDNNIQDMYLLRDVDIQNRDQIDLQKELDGEKVEELKNTFLYGVERFDETSVSDKITNKNFILNVPVIYTEEIQIKQQLFKLCGVVSLDNVSSTYTNYNVYVKNPCKSDELLKWTNNNTLFQNSSQKATIVNGFTGSIDPNKVILFVYVLKDKLDQISRETTKIPASVPASASVPTVPASASASVPTVPASASVPTVPTVPSVPASEIATVSSQSLPTPVQSTLPDEVTSQVQNVKQPANDKLKDQLNVLQTRSTKDVSLYVPPDTTDIIKNVLQNLPPNILDGRESALTIVEVEEKKDCLMYVEVDTSKPPVNVMKMGADGDNADETINYKVKNEPSTAAKVYKLNFSDVANVGVGGMCMIKYKDEILCTYLKVKPDGWIMLNNFVDVNANDTNSIYIQTVGQFTINGLRINSN